MINRILCVVGMTALLMTGAPVFAKDIKIGFISTLTTPAALIGKQLKAGAELAMDHIGNKMGGRNAKILFEDDGFSPKIGKQKTEKLIKKDKVDIVAGYIWSHVLAASAPVVLKANKFIFSSNAGHSIFAGKKCHKNFFNVSWENSQNAAATGALLNKKGVKRLYILSLNYAAGKQVVGGIERGYKGKVVGKDFVPLSHKDWSAELTKIRSVKPDAVVVFYPGAWGPKFFGQYAQAGLKGKIPLYHVFSVDMGNLPIFQKVGLNVLNTMQTAQWSPDFKNPQNQKFVAGFKKKYGMMPNHFAAQAYETIMLIKSGVDAVNGDVSKMDEMRVALEKANFTALRGNFRYEKEHYPIQDFYAREVVKGSDGKWTIVQRGKVVSNSRAPNHEECKR
ncbi:MAG TPA: ABC transporter substrate-binding protein [Rhodospirillales bacterium]|jgi:branched-chain amino acid transport system substrate-binding protein|nr:ABC transporter substrate-binding protein [Rhodospirillales bacterium]HIL76027.1 ABC transporter substrate-binding protein [Rhodospirillales bacterium]